MHIPLSTKSIRSKLQLMQEFDTTFALVVSFRIFSVLIKLSIFLVHFLNDFKTF